MKLKTDKLPVSAYVRHGDICSLAPHCESLHCVSGHKSNDYVLVAKFAYLQEGIDYCRDGAKVGCRMLLVSRITREYLYWYYVPEGMAVESHKFNGSVRMVARSTTSDKMRDAGSQQSTRASQPTT